MNPSSAATHTAFLDDRRLASGPLAEVAVAVQRAQRAHPEARLLVFNDASGRCIDLDLRGSEAEVAARHTEATPAPEAEPQPAPKGRGRPRLGVVAREVTLLPEHWDWLASQPGGASVALRRLVHEARRHSGERDRRRLAQERSYHAMSTLAGHRAGFEEASRALFAGEHARWVAQMAGWPEDLRAYLLQLADTAGD